MSATTDGTLHDSDPKRKDWAENNKGQYGSSPGLQDPDDASQNPDTAEANHLEKAAQRVGARLLQTPQRRNSETPRVGHFEHKEHTRSPS